jgi:hypothetical protein
MLNKFLKDFAIVVLAYLWASSLVGRLVGTIVYNVLPSDPVTSAVISGIAFALSYLGAWLFFNKWEAKLWLKICIAIGVIIISRIILIMVDRITVSNM